MTGRDLTLVLLHPHRKELRLAHLKSEGGKNYLKH
jgi:hypothetical protein